MTTHTFKRDVDPNLLHDRLNELVPGFRVIAGINSINGYPTEASNCGSVYSNGEVIMVRADDHITRDDIEAIITTLR